MYSIIDSGISENDEDLLKRLIVVICFINLFFLADKKHTTRGKY